MPDHRSIALSIAGLDPSAGAGLLADIKTFEQNKVYGLGISTAQTLQTEERFYTNRWEQASDIFDAIEKLLCYYQVTAIKIGIVKNVDTLAQIVSLINEMNKEIKIVVDPVILSSTGHPFWEDMNSEIFLKILPMVFLITPNYKEVLQLFPSPDEKKAAGLLSAYCNVLLKGGHNNEERGTDYLYSQGEVKKITAGSLMAFTKHGSGCVLSAAITANIAKGSDLLSSCIMGKKYIERFLVSNETLLGYHHV